MSNPKFSLKQLLLSMVLVALVLGTLSLAVQGSPIALGFALAGVVLLILVLVYQAVFGLLYLYAERRTRKSNLPPETKYE